MSFRPDGSFRYDGPWRRVRKAILERDSYICQIRGPNCTIDATCVDHVIPVEFGGALYDPENLRASCKRDNEDRARETQRKLRQQAERRPSQEW